MVKFFLLLNRFCFAYLRYWKRSFIQKLIKAQLGDCGHNVEITPKRVFDNNLKRIHMADNTNIYSDFRFISASGHFFMGRNSGAAQGLTVVTGNHSRICGSFLKEFSASHINDTEKDIIVEEDVWIGANVTLLAGSHIGRGVSIGAGTVVRNEVPPYSVVVGNPAKIVGFSFTPEEIIEHEKKLYSPENRFSLECLEKNYKKYCLDRISEIKKITKI